MKTFNLLSNLTSLAILSLIVVYSLPAQVTDTIHVEAGWNLLSLPVDANDGSVNNLFPSATSNGFIYQNSYIAIDTIEDGYGFWIKYDAPDTVILFGGPIYENAVGVNSGWNIVGSLTNPILVNKVIDIPDGIIISDFYKYVPGIGYETSDTIKPGLGYWVKVSENGSIQIYNNPPHVPSNPNPINNSTGIYNNITLSWYCSDPDGDLT